MSGGRVLLERLSCDGENARYALTLFTTISFPGEALFTGPKVELTVPDAPAWLLDVARALCVTLAKRVKEGEPWPRRLNRWRPEK